MKTKIYFTLQVLKNNLMDQRAFVFATRGHCIIGKQCLHIAIKNKICV